MFYVESLTWMDIEILQWIYMWAPHMQWAE